MMIFKSSQDLAFDAFFSCHVSGCDLEAEKIYATETKIVDVCSNHYTELMEKSFR